MSNNRESSFREKTIITRVMSADQALNELRQKLTDFGPEEYPDRDNPQMVRLLDSIAAVSALLGEATA